VLQGGDTLEKEQFVHRLVELRVKKGVSARDMSLSLGQSPGYINNIENGVNLPSMTVFFWICDYFEISPKDFFDTSIQNPSKVNDLCAAAKKLDDEQLGHLIAITEAISQK